MHLSVLNKQMSIEQENIPTGNQAAVEEPEIKKIRIDDPGLSDNTDTRGSSPSGNGISAAETTMNETLKVACESIEAADESDEASEEIPQPTEEIIQISEEECDSEKAISQVADADVTAEPECEQEADHVVSEPTECEQVSENAICDPAEECEPADTPSEANPIVEENS